MTYSTISGNTFDLIYKMNQALCEQMKEFLEESKIESEKSIESKNSVDSKPKTTKKKSTKSTKKTKESV